MKVVMKTNIKNDYQQMIVKVNSGGFSYNCTQKNQYN